MPDVLDIEYISGKKYVNRTVNLKTGTMLEVNYETETFNKTSVCLVDWDKPLPPNFHLDDERDVKIRMPLENFVATGEFVEKE